jgi:molybdenum cofactor guanylyltransferase
MCVPIVGKISGNMRSNLINGLILSGGKSTRMGRDKSLIDFHGKPQREYLFDVLAKFCNTVYLSCKTETDIAAELNPLVDQFELDSPLNGILSAFTVHPGYAWLTVPVDMPNVSGEVIQYLIKHRDESKLATCFFDSEGKKPEPLLTLWEVNAASFLNAFFESGNKSPRKFLETHPVNIITTPKVGFLTNINSPDDLLRYRQANSLHKE